MADGLTVEQAAKAVGVPRSTLYRWEAAPEPRSRKPHRPRKPAWTPALVRAVEELRADNPMYGKRKLAVLLRREGTMVSTSTVGRILRKRERDERSEDGSDWTHIVTQNRDAAPIGAKATARSIFDDVDR